MNKKIVSISLLSSIAVIIVVIIFNYSNRGMNVNNGFKRNLYRPEATLLRQMPFDNENYIFIRLTSDQIRLAKYRRPYEILDVSIDFKTVRHYFLTKPLKIIHTNGMNSVAFIGKDKFIITGDLAKVYRINGGKKIIDSSDLDTTFIAQSATLSSNRFLITRRVLDQGLIRRKLVIVDWGGKSINEYLPEKQIDGFFCTDGQFRYNKDSKLLVYTYYYRGQFICLDSNLNVIYKAKTIDTITRARMLLKKTSNDFMTYTSPPHIINKGVYLSGNKVYVRSNIKADNEKFKKFNNSDVIDVYSQVNGKYSYSFYVPNLDHKKLYEFSIYKNTLVGTYKDLLAVFKIPEPLK